MTLFVTVLHVLVCIFLIVVVLLQRGKGAEVGAVFGAGGSATMFGSRGAGNFLTRLTSAAAVIFMITSLTLAYFGRERTGSTLFEEDKPAAEAPAESPFATPPPAGAGGFEEVKPESPPAGGATAPDASAAPAPAQKPAEAPAAGDAAAAKPDAAAGAPAEKPTGTP